MTGRANLARLILIIIGGRNQFGCARIDRITTLQKDRLGRLLVDQLVQPVRWDACCADMIAWRAAQGLSESCKIHELAPGTVLRGLMRRIDKATEVTTHDSVAETQNAKS